MIDKDIEIIHSLVDWVQSLTCHRDEDAETSTVRNAVIRSILEKINNRLAK